MTLIDLLADYLFEEVIREETVKPKLYENDRAEGIQSHPLHSDRNSDSVRNSNSRGN